MLSNELEKEKTVISKINERCLLALNLVKRETHTRKKQLQYCAIFTWLEKGGPNAGQWKSYISLDRGCSRGFPGKRMFT